MAATSNQGSSLRVIKDNQLGELLTAVIAKKGDANKPSPGFHCFVVKSSMKRLRHKLNVVLTPRKQGGPRDM